MEQFLKRIIEQNDRLISLQERTLQRLVSVEETMSTGLAVIESSISVLDGTLSMVDGSVASVESAVEDGKMHVALLSIRDVVEDLRETLTEVSRREALV